MRSLLLAPIKISILGVVVLIAQALPDMAVAQVDKSARSEPRMWIHAREDHDALSQSLQMQFLFDRHLTAAQKAAPLEPELDDAILRVEGMFDPTRIGLFGRSLRLQVRPGSAFMTDVLDGRWARAALDPNLHRHVDFLAKVWYGSQATDCRDFWIDRRTESAVALDGLTTLECAEMKSQPGDQTFAAVVSASLSLPVFAAPYPGGRLSSREMAVYQRARFKILEENHWFHGPSRVGPSIGSRGTGERTPHIWRPSSHE